MFGERRNDATSLHRQVNSSVKLDVAIRESRASFGSECRRSFTTVVRRRLRPIECARQNHLKGDDPSGSPKHVIARARQNAIRPQKQCFPPNAATSTLASFRKIEFSAFQQAQEARLGVRAGVDLGTKMPDFTWRFQAGAQTAIATALLPSALE
jgi:hypothetical protein